ncbi:hypothetical protein NITHO_4560003 [Nitrolancea hollandica Lb]|uniref:Uncharacterized protein n=1 Tax=Nitrolancea hollandica Lb TaxID=1129897 RepID=I4EKD2_9BACT|nr:hypothetical protein NITHO_4560003 [Nitrolancea hollandica Lb]
MPYARGNYDRNGINFYRHEVRLQSAALRSILTDQALMDQFPVVTFSVRQHAFHLIN